MILLSNKQRLDIIEASRGGDSWRNIAKRLDIPKSTVSDFLSTRTHKEWWADNQKYLSIANFSGAKILIYDVENSPEIACTWSRWKANIGENQVIQRPYMLTWAAKWLGTDEIVSDSIHNYPGYMDDLTNDINIIRTLWALIDEADIIVAHNGDRHDEPLFNTRCLVHGLQPPTPYRRIDTLKAVKGAFKFPSNALKSLLNHLDLTRKIENSGFELWKGCMEGDTASFDEMLDYNHGDVISLEELYLKIRPWIKGHPNVSMYGDNKEKACVACGSTDLTFLPEKTAYTNVSAFSVHRCNECDKISRDRVSKKTTAQRKNILTNAL